MSTSKKQNSFFSNISTVFKVGVHATLIGLTAYAVYKLRKKLLVQAPAVIQRNPVVPYQAPQGQVRMPVDVVQLSNRPTYVRHVDQDGDPIPGNRMLANNQTRNLLLVDWQPYDVPIYDWCWDFFGFPLISVPQMMRPSLMSFGKTRDTLWWGGRMCVVGRRQVDLPTGVVNEVDAFWASQDSHTEREFRVSVERTIHLLRDVDIHPELYNRLVWDIPCVCYEHSVHHLRLGVAPWSADVVNYKSGIREGLEFSLMFMGLVTIFKYGVKRLE